MIGPNRRRTSRWYHDPFVRWTSGSRNSRTNAGSAEGLYAARRRGRDHERWLAADVFAPDGAGSTADPSLPPFTIIQPPPNVTGSLHLGHAQRTAVEDLMIRHARMSGHPALFLPGLDHASIAAQFVLDGIIAEKGRAARPRARAIPRADARVRGHDPRGDARTAAPGRRVARLGPAPLHDGRRLGKGGPGGLQALYRDLAYRTEALVNWCPGCRTSVSDLEVISKPETGTLWSVRYHLLDEVTGEPDRTRRSPSRPPAPRRSSATPPWRSIPTTSAMRRSSAPRADPIRRARRADHRGRCGGSRVRDRRGEDHPGP